jgi:hypothetical protein
MSGVVRQGRCRARARKRSLARPQSTGSKDKNVPGTIVNFLPTEPLIRLKKVSRDNHLIPESVQFRVEYPMAPRPHWKGYLKLSLVSCPIGLYPAISAAEKVSFRHVNRETGHRLRQQLVDSVTGDVVESHNKGRGYEVGENHFLIVQDEELEAAQREARTRPFTAVSPRARRVGAQPELPPSKRGAAPKFVDPPKVEEEAPPIAPPGLPRPIIENTRTIELDRFIPRDQIDPRYYATPYYIAPRDQVGLEAFAVIRDAMAAKGFVGIGRVVLSNRERPIMIEPMGTDCAASRCATSTRCAVRRSISRTSRLWLCLTRC